MKHILFVFVVSSCSTLFAAEAHSQEPPHKPRDTQLDQAKSRTKQLYRVEVEDGIEAALIEQQLRIRPETLNGKSFYYFGDPETNERLKSVGYEPLAANPDEVFNQLVRVRRRGTERALRDTGATIVLRERRDWVVRVTQKQIRVLKRLGYVVTQIGRREVLPRQIRIEAVSEQDVAEIGGLRVDIHHVKRTNGKFVVLGGAFDDVIDGLRSRGFSVQILPDPPGVTR